MGEYAIIVALIAIVSISALMVLSGQINIELSGAMPKQTELSKLATAKPVVPMISTSPVGSSTSAASGQLVEPLSTNIQSAVLSTNDAMTFSQTSSDLIETAGANGTIKPLKENPLGVCFL